MFKRKWGFFAASSIAFIILITIPLLINNNVLNNQENLIVYIIAKVVFLLLLLLTTIYVLVKDTARGTSIFLVTLAFFMQLAPLFIRLTSRIQRYGYIYSIVIIGAFLIIFSIASFVILATDKKMLEADKKYEANSVDLLDGGKKDE